ncbi:MAG: hypothetical protein H0T79_00920 [Deltaproteobacteria bacterium]|nr:hypothetical protein [Deltaproteobacteria bacterium]
MAVGSPPDLARDPAAGKTGSIPQNDLNPRGAVTAKGDAAAAEAAATPSATTQGAENAAREQAPVKPNVATPNAAQANAQVASSTPKAPGIPAEGRADVAVESEVGASASTTTTLPKK